IGRAGPRHRAEPGGPGPDGAAAVRLPAGGPGQDDVLGGGRSRLRGAAARRGGDRGGRGRGARVRPADSARPARRRPPGGVGGGEYLAVMAGVEGALIEGRPPRYVQIPTAAAPEGTERLRYWLDLGAAQAGRLGVEQVPVVVRDRDEAGSADLAALIDGAGL